MRIAVAGSSGLVGTALCASLTADGHDVLRLVRRPATDSSELHWDPAIGDVDPNPLEGIDAAVNLAGAGVGERRWSKAYKQLLRSSRIHTTAFLANTLAGLDDPPRVFVSASGINYYGTDRGNEVLDENSEPDGGFLAGLCRDWEEAAQAASAAGIAVCQTRFGIVLDRHQGAMSRMLPLFRWGLGGPLAGGRQYWSFISLADTVNALRFLIEKEGCAGAYNMTAPEPVTNAEFTRVLAYLLSRPALLPAPWLALRIALGEFAHEIAGSLRVVPTRLTESGFTHQHPTARSAIAHALSS
ncbi:TIGR01777 family protein [Actinobacteria bacterium YIM 96077]|uniref:TIGR01777 family protein n=1 Tax=Phytoactinopolyspora halophila TaxID=1981511 RepID=A0A329QC95_9ACTN|nr:TIGR01777 family oxidoreductase [Phytoactinopolyspora halophila]AYY13699.1 TIGR01777 family protein [Actinobacteria bacterium YIM 96077]RAW09369.1 TIGR01777 family protein [Phytoactinopolyspora halophila]